ncbi:MAG: NAD-dependent DNA ligase LigA [Candidatus Kerfeldbacteria bacterium]|nr:NAD-dependent DNA ligase LigA [Candidatus Kerfeldbacteria bacterium]
MTKVRARERIAKLRREIERHRELYHVHDRQEISDAALDSLKRELLTLEQQYPDLVTPDSPTQRVGGRPLAQFAKVRHATPMLSLEDAFDADEARAWEARLQKLLHTNRLDYYAEVKVDGVSLSLVYEDGALVRGATRGDGQVGEDVTQNVKTIEAVPLRIPIERLPKAWQAAARRRLEVRGEVFMRRDAFERMNRSQAKAGLPPFANPRNASAGAVRQLDPAVTASRRLTFVAWDVPTDLGQTTHEESHAVAKTLGFPTIALNRHCPTLDSVLALHASIGKRREKLHFWLDGIVVNVNAIAQFRKLGVAGKAPRGALAFKYPAEQATTVVEDIQVQVGRTGALTPVAHLKPVPVAGTTVSRATLHNQDEIDRLEVRVKDTVIIEKAGDIIPDVVRVLENLRPAGTKPYRMPTACPICGHKVHRPAGEVAHYCPNERCPARLRESLYHFVSKSAFDIAGLGRNIIDVFVDEGLVATPADFFTLTEPQLVGLPLFAETKAKNVVQAIAAAKRVPLHRFILALGIRHVGEQTALDLAAHFGTLGRVRAASVDAIDQIEDIGGTVAQSVASYFAAPANRKLIDRLLRLGVRVQAAERTSSTHLQGATFVVTGTLDTMTRDEAHRRIRAAGGAVASSVSNKTTYVVVGSEPGTKAEKARALGVTLLNEEDFLKVLGRG